MAKACCEDFWEEGLKPRHGRPQMCLESDGTWSVDGCCGGGCSVLFNLRFCPWCGAPLPKEVPDA